MNEFKKLIINGYAQKSVWNKLIKMLKILTKRSRRKNSENTPDAITPITPIAEKDDEKNEYPNFLKRVSISNYMEIWSIIWGTANDDYLYFFVNGKTRFSFDLWRIYTRKYPPLFQPVDKKITSPFFHETSALHRTCF